MDSRRIPESSSVELVCIGFGVTTISNAIALYEREALDKTLFLEARSRTEWKPCLNAPSSRLRSSFLHDLITSENPRSKFTFLNYLHVTNRLVLYANSSQLNPSREMFQDYLRWCATHFESQVGFGKLVTEIRPLPDGDGLVSRWKIVFKDSISGQSDFVVAKQVIYAVEPEPVIPAILSRPAVRQMVLHSSDCLDGVLSEIGTSLHEMNIGIIGEGQSAAEVFGALQAVRGNHRVTWFSENSVLMAMDETPFVMHRLHMPGSKRDRLLPPEMRRKALTGTSREGQSPVEVELLKSLYETQYAQSIKNSDPGKWRFQIKLQQNLIAAEKVADGKTCMVFRDLDNEGTDTISDVFDVVIAATGHKSNGFETVMIPLISLIDGHRISVDRDYRVNLRSHVLNEGCGLWLQGTLGEALEDYDCLYSTAAERSRRLVESLQRVREAKPKTHSTEEQAARL